MLPPALAARAAALLAAVAAALGLLLPDAVYPAESSTRAQLLALDAVTLVLVAPALLWAARAADAGSVRGHLLALGALAHLAGSYALYAFGLPPTGLFLGHVAVLSLAVYGLVTGALRRSPVLVQHAFDLAAPARATGVFLVSTGVLLGSLWTTDLLVAAWTGRPPVLRASFGAAAGGLYAVDLGFVVPAAVAGGSDLYRRRPVGYVLGAVVLVRAGASALAVLAMAAALAGAGRPVPAALVSVFAALAVLAGAFGWAFFRRVRRAAARSTRVPDAV